MGKRIKPVEKRWRVNTKNTYMVHARIPKDMMDDLRKYVDVQGTKITDVVIMGLCDVLRGEPMYIPRRDVTPGRKRRDVDLSGLLGDYFL